MRCRSGPSRWGPLLLVSAALYRGSAQAEESATAVVWYRGSTECPTGQQFLEKLGARAPLARLADAGDHIDFIVTLVATPTETVGRLERQTQAGTVAIRALHDPSCAQVAEALALSLALSLEPARSVEPAPEPPVETPAPAAEPAASPPLEPSPYKTEGSTPRTRIPTLAWAPIADVRTTKGGERARPRRTLGVHGGVLMGISPEPMAFAAAFFDLDGALPNLVRALSLRFGVVGGIGSAQTAVGSVTRSVLAAQAEVCPLRWGGTRWAFRPCAAMELGVTDASTAQPTSVHATGLWAAPGALIRSTFDVDSSVTLEARVAGVVPVPRQEVAVGSQPLYQDTAIVFEGTVGFSVRVE